MKSISLLAALLAAVSPVLAQQAPAPAPAPKVMAEPRSLKDDALFRENRMSVSIAAGPLFDVGGNPSEDVLSSTLLSWHWQLDDVGNEGWRRGNTEWVTTAYWHPVWDGTESRFLGGVFGPRYNFVQEGWSWVPYLGARVGFAFTDSRDNRFFDGAQGQDFCFTFMVEAGARYVINERMDLLVGAMYQHFSNAGLSEPARINNGLDVLGPTVALNVRF